MGKIKNLSELEKICRKLREKGKKIGLITGCFDLLHLGHIDLFRFAKKHVDILIVGIDNDASIKLSKGKDRPVFSQNERAQSLAELTSVNYIFTIKRIIKFDIDAADIIYEEIIKKLQPSALITTSSADKYWSKKKRRAEKFGIKFLNMKEKHIGSSSKIIKILEKDL